jgi:DNA-directed RNA polymerase specialized sigma24 family protein
MSDEESTSSSTSLEVIAVQLGRIANLMAMEALGQLEDKPQAERIKLLLQAGFSAMETASLVGTSPATVRNARSRLRSERGSAS